MVGMIGKVAELQAALDFVMLKTQLQRLSVIGGGYGIIACLYGLPTNNQNLYLVHVLLGIALLVAGGALFLVPKPRQMIVLGILLAAMGVWIDVMAGFGEGAGGSPELFAAWGSGMAFVGVIALVDYRRFAYLRSQMPSRVEIQNAGVIVKKLLSANPKKHLDVIFLYIKADSKEQRDMSFSEWLTTTRNTVKWKARLLSDAMVLIQGGQARALVLHRRDFIVRTAPEKHATDSGFKHTVCISEREYTAVMTQESSQRLGKWLLIEEQLTSGF